MLSASHDKTVRIWDLRARGNKPIQVLTGAVDSILCLMTHGDVASLIWDCSSLFFFSFIFWHLLSMAAWPVRSQKIIFALSIPFCKEIVTGSVDGGLRSYDVRQGQLVTDCTVGGRVG